MSSSPRENGRKVRAILEAREGSARLYRTAVAGPSGQRRAVCVGRVEYTGYGRYEIQVFTPGENNEAGYAARTSDARGEWTVWSDDGTDGIWLAGWASSLSVAADVLINGAHAAQGRHDHYRVSRGTWVPYVPREI
jgi:hypothetical protein